MWRQGVFAAGVVLIGAALVQATWRFSRGHLSRPLYVDELCFGTGFMAGLLSNLVERLSEALSWFLLGASLVLCSTFLVRKVRRERTPGAE
jgi:hypothetical protein